LRTKSLLNSARRLAWALVLSLAACSPPAQWIAVTGEDAREMVLFKSDLSVQHVTPLAASDFGGASTLTAVFARDGASFYVAHTGSSGSYLSLIRRSDGRVLGRRDFSPGLTPRTLMLTRDARTLIVTASPATGGRVGTISLLFSDSFIERSRIEPCRGHPVGLAVLPDLDRGYTRCHGDEATVIEVDVALGRVANTMALDQGAGLAPHARRCGPGGIALSPSGNVLLIPCSASGSLLYLDRLTLQVLDSIPVGVGAHHIAAAPRDPVALVTFPDSNAASLIDLARRSIIARIITPGNPGAVDISGDGRMGYILCGGESEPRTLLMFDLRTQDIENTVRMAPGSQTLTIWPGKWSPTMRWR